MVGPREPSSLLARRGIGRAPSRPASLCHRHPRNHYRLRPCAHPPRWAPQPAAPKPLRAPGRLGGARTLQRDTHLSPRRGECAPPAPLCFMQLQRRPSLPAPPLAASPPPASEKRNSWSPRIQAWKGPGCGPRQNRNRTLRNAPFPPPHTYAGLSSASPGALSLRRCQQHPAPSGPTPHQLHQKLGGCVQWPGFSGPSGDSAAV